MFIRNDNTLKWKWIGWGTVITLVLALLGILFFDKPISNEVKYVSHREILFTAI